VPSRIRDEALVSLPSPARPLSSRALSGFSVPIWVPISATRPDRSRPPSIPADYLTTRPATHVLLATGLVGGEAHGDHAVSSGSSDAGHLTDPFLRPTGLAIES
jgi:hypothetical protein